MTESTMSPPMMYIGRELKKQGKNTGNDGQEREWKVFKLRFDSGEQYAFNCSAFDRISDLGVQPGEMVEGNFYQVLYSVSEFEIKSGPKKGQKGKGKQAIRINKAATPAVGALPGQAPAAATPVSVPAFSKEKWDQFSKEYDELTAGAADVTPYHMLGVWVLNNAREQFREVIVACKEHFKKPEPEKPAEPPKPKLEL